VARSFQEHPEPAQFDGDALSRPARRIFFKKNPDKDSHLIAIDPFSVGPNYGAAHQHIRHR
jgi:hypothetical protein